MIEAIEKGHDFKRAAMLNWLFVDKRGIVMARQGCRAYVYKLRREDALAEDWEVKG